MKEIWKDIKGFEGYYQISNYGNIKSLERKIKVNNHWKQKEKIIKGNFVKTHPNSKDYLVVNLCQNHKRRTAKVHRIVAENFIPNPENLPILHHKDHNRQNNRADGRNAATVTLP